MMEHISTMNVLPSSTELPKAPDVQSLGVRQENVKFPQGNSLCAMAEMLSDNLYKEVVQRGIHPGHCAVLYSEGGTSQLFPPQDGGLPKFVQLVNEKLKGKVVESQAEHMLQISQSIEDTILFSKHKHTSEHVNTSFPLETSKRDVATQMTGNVFEVMCFWILLIDEMCFWILLIDDK